MSSTQGQLLAKLRHDAQQVVYQQRGLHSMLTEWSEMEAEFQEIEALAMDEVLKSKLLKQPDRAAERHARFERAYMAALPITTQFYLREQRFQAARMDAHRIALETIRQWDAMMAELDWEEGI